MRAAGLLLMACGCGMFLLVQVRAATDPQPNVAWMVQLSTLLLLSGVATFAVGLVRKKRG